MAAKARSGCLEHVEEMALSVNSANNITNSTADGSKGGSRLPGTRGGEALSVNSANNITKQQMAARAG